MSAGHGSGGGKGMAIFGLVILTTVIAVLFMVLPEEYQLLIGAIALVAGLGLTAVIFCAKSVVFNKAGHALIQEEFGDPVGDVKRSPGPAWVPAYRRPIVVHEEIKTLDTTIRIVTSGSAQPIPGLSMLASLPEGLAIEIDGFIRYRDSATVLDAMGNPQVLRVSRQNRETAIRHASESVGTMIGSGYTMGDILLHLPEVDKIHKCRLELSRMPNDDSRFLDHYGVRRPVPHKLPDFFRRNHARVDEWIERWAATESSRTEKDVAVEIIETGIRRVRLPPQIDALNQRRVYGIVFGELVKSYVDDYGMTPAEAKISAAQVLGFDAQTREVRSTGTGRGRNINVIDGGHGGSHH